MAAKKKSKVIDFSSNQNTQKTSVEVPDQAVDYIVQKFLIRKSTEGVPLVVGISTDVVETVLGLFLEWAAQNNYIKDGVFFFGGQKVG